MTDKWPTEAMIEAGLRAWDGAQFPVEDGGVATAEECLERIYLAMEAARPTDRLDYPSPPPMPSVPLVHWEMRDGHPRLVIDRQGMTPERIYQDAAARECERRSVMTPEEITQAALGPVPSWPK